MGHARIPHERTERHLHARSASELADKFTRALAADDPSDQAPGEIVATQFVAVLTPPRVSHPPLWHRAIEHPPERFAVVGIARWHSSWMTT